MSGPGAPTPGDVRGGWRPGTLAWCLLLAAAIAAGTGCHRDEPRPLLVFAAASIADGVGVLAAELEREGGPAAAISAGSSTALQRQIEAGAPVDLFVSAAPQPVEALIAAGRADPGERMDLLANRLVCVVARESPSPPLGPGDLLAPELGRIAVGDTDLVPAGIYAREALTRLGLWEPLRPRLLPAADVRAALAYVETGAAGAGIVYATDAAISSRVQAAFTFPAGSHAPIVYSAIVPAAAPQPEAARRLLAYLASPRGMEVFRQAGFTPAAAPEPVF